MASPFKVFRKNQKMMIALLTILVMFGFVFLPIILERMGGQSQANPVVVKTSKFGDLRESDLQSLRTRHQKVLGVLVELRAMGEVRARVAAGKLSAEDVVKVLGYYSMIARQRMENVFGKATEEGVVNLWLLARHVEQMGMVVSNETINDFLMEVTSNAVKAKDFQNAFRGAGMSDRQFFALMRDELMARQFQTMFQISLLATTPGQRWDYFNRVKRMATVEAVPVTVADYVNQLKDPSEEELKKFFDENKNRHPSPFSPEPGFRRPHKVALEYFKADVEKFAAPEMVTEEEIQLRYEEDKDSYDKLSQKPSTEEPASGLSQRPSTEEPAGGLSQRPSTEEPAGEEEKKPGEVEKKESAKDTTDTKETKSSKETNKEPKETKNEVKKVEKEELSEDLKNRIRRDVAKDKIGKIFEDLHGPMEQYRRRRSEYDVKAIQSRAEAGKENEEKKLLGPPPSRPDFEKLAQQNGLSADHTALVSQWDAQGSDIGASLVEGRTPVWYYAYQALAKFHPKKSQDLRGDLYLFWKVEDVKEHVPKFTDKDVREEVLREWKMIHARDLALAQAKSLADAARKTQKHLEQAFADRPELRVVLPPPFSWMTFGSVALGAAQNARLSDVTGVEMAGREFMRTVFRLEPGQVGVAFNAPRTIVYVVRPTEFQPSYEVRKAQFEVDDFSKYASVGADDHRQMFQAWLEEIKTSAGFKWVADRKPDQMMEREQSAEE